MLFLTSLQHRDRDISNLAGNLLIQKTFSIKLFCPTNYTLQSSNASALARTHISSLLLALARLQCHPDNLVYFEHGAFLDHINVLIEAADTTQASVRCRLNSPAPVFTPGH